MPLKKKKRWSSRYGTAGKGSSTVSSYGSFPSPVQWIKDPALPQLWLKFNPWPGNFHMPWVRLKKKKKRCAILRTSFLLLIRTHFSMNNILSYTSLCEHRRIYHCFLIPFTFWEHNPESPQTDCRNYKTNPKITIFDDYKMLYIWNYM